MSRAKRTGDGTEGALADPVALFNIRRLLRAQPDLLDYGILPNGTDYGQSDFDAILDDLGESGLFNLLVPPGNYDLGEGVTIPKGIAFEGFGKSHSVFVMYHAGTGMTFTGTGGVGGALKKLSIVNNAGSTCVAYVQLVASLDGFAPDFFEIVGCNFTGFSSNLSQYGIIADGNARDGSAPNLLQGIRAITLQDTQIFNCTTRNLDLRNARAPILRAVECYQAGASQASTSINGATAPKASFNVRMDGCIIGDLYIDHASIVLGDDNYIDDVTATANSSSSRVGVAFGTVSNSGSDVTVIVP